MGVAGARTRDYRGRMHRSGLFRHPLHVLFLSACVGTSPCVDGYGRAANGACVPLEVGEEQAPLTVDTGARDTSSGDTGQPDTSAEDTSPPIDTAPPPLDTALSEAPPWATESNMDPHGDMPCEDPDRPCNHQLRLAVGEGDALVELDHVLALRGSVASAMVVDHGDLDGLHWVELQVVYLDFFQPNFGRGDESNPARARISAATGLIVCRKAPHVLRPSHRSCFTGLVIILSCRLSFEISR